MALITSAKHQNKYLPRDRLYTMRHNIRVPGAPEYACLVQEGPKYYWPRYGPKDPHKVHLESQRVWLLTRWYTPEMKMIFYVGPKESEFNSFLFFLLHWTPTVGLTNHQIAVYTEHFRYEYTVHRWPNLHEQFFCFCFCFFLFFVFLHEQFPDAPWLENLTLERKLSGLTTHYKLKYICYALVTNESNIFSSTCVACGNWILTP